MTSQVYDVTKQVFTQECWKKNFYSHFLFLFLLWSSLTSHLQHSWICWNKITGWIWGFFSRGELTVCNGIIKKNNIPFNFCDFFTIFFHFSTPLGVLFPTHYKKTCILRTSKATSFPGSLFSASLGRWKKDPVCGWSHDHPESGW